MKYTISDEPTRDFVPIRTEIIIETEEELVCLLKLGNQRLPGGLDSWWNELGDIADARGIRK